MEEELELNEEINEEAVEDIVPADDTVETISDTIGIETTLDIEDTSYVDSEETTTYVGDEDDTSNETAEDNSEEKWGSLDCYSECKYNTGDKFKYANYGYSD